MELRVLSASLHMSLEHNKKIYFLYMYYVDTLLNNKSSSVPKLTFFANRLFYFAKDHVHGLDRVHEVRTRHPCNITCTILWNVRNFHIFILIIALENEKVILNKDIYKGFYSKVKGNVCWFKLWFSNHCNFVT